MQLGHNFLWTVKTSCFIYLFIHLLFCWSAIYINNVNHFVLYGDILML